VVFAGRIHQHAIDYLQREQLFINFRQAIQHQLSFSTLQAVSGQASSLYGLIEEADDDAT